MATAQQRAAVMDQLPLVIGLSKRTPEDKRRAQAADKTSHAKLRSLRSLAGGYNSQCCDCTARNPGWAALPWGALVCIDCAQLHRSMGRHISQVKSFSSGTYLWYPDEVAAMQTMGNGRVNALLAGHSTAPAKPNAAAPRHIKEKYVRDKYERLKWLSSGRKEATENVTAAQRSARHKRQPPAPRPAQRAQKCGRGADFSGNGAAADLTSLLDDQSSFERCRKTLPPALSDTLSDAWAAALSDGTIAASKTTPKSKRAMAPERRRCCAAELKPQSPDSADHDFFGAWGV